MPTVHHVAGVVGMVLLIGGAAVVILGALASLVAVGVTLIREGQEGWIPGCAFIFLAVLIVVGIVYGLSGG